MKSFKFFRGYGSTTLNTIDVESHATASFNSDTPDGYVYRRHLYHTNRELYERLNNPFNNNEMERYYYDNRLGRFETVRPTLNQEEVTEEILRHRHNFFEKERATTVNPKWWMKIKMFFQKLFLYSDQIFPIVIFSTLITVIVCAVIAKILNVW